MKRLATRVLIRGTVRLASMEKLPQNVFFAYLVVTFQ